MCLGESVVARREFHVLDGAGQQVGRPIVLEYVSEAEASGALGDAAVEALARSGMRVERVDDEDDDDEVLDVVTVMRESVEHTTRMRRAAALVNGEEVMES